MTVNVGTYLTFWIHSCWYTLSCLHIKNGNLLDYIITRQSSDIASNLMVPDKISDHMVLHASLVCQHPHPERKSIFVRDLRRIKNDYLEAVLAGINIDSENVNVVVAQYDTPLSRLLDKLAH